MSSGDHEPFIVGTSALSQAIATMRQALSAHSRPAHGSERPWAAGDDARDGDGPTLAVLRSWSCTLERIEAAHAALVEHGRRQAQSVATVSHELRNPLSTVSAALAVLQAQPTTGPWLSGDRTFRIVREQVDHMARLLDDLTSTPCDAAMQLARPLLATDLAALAEQAVLAVEDRVQRRGQRLTLELPPQEIWLHADPGRLSQVLVNLLDNASKYTGDGGELGMRLEADEHTCVVRIWDDGIGIGGRELVRVRGMFAQGDSLPGRVASGMGIGLGLAARIVELHGGQLEIVSRDQGRPQGTEVVVRLVRRRG